MKAEANKMHRPENRLERSEYLVRARELALRGEDLPHSKIKMADVEEIRSAIVQRDQLRKYISTNLSNEALARKFGVHIRTIEKIVQGRTWIHCSN
jgi:hypothetical protein